MSFSQETLYAIALTRISYFNAATCLQLYRKLGSATAIMENRHNIKDIISDASPRLIHALSDVSEALHRAEAELEFDNAHAIRPLTMACADYPERMRNCDDAPIVLFYRGTADLNPRRVISIVGTRHCTAYGQDLVNNFCRSLKELCPDVLIMSGLAYGVDICAHRNALINGFDTVGVLAHGLDMLYPSAHSEKTVLVVDCENSDPYKLCATLKNLDYEVMQKITAIILFDDVHTATAWRILENYTRIPVEHIMIERIKQNKSLVDIKLTARACQEHYQKQVDSFVIVSSDSDYWGLISSLPDARFLVMIEREKCGPDMKEALADSGIFYCYLDDFYSGNSEDIKKNALFKEMYRWIDNSVHLNVNDMFDAALRNTRIDMSPAERRQFYEKHIKHMTLQIDEDGNVGIELKRG